MALRCGLESFDFEEADFAGPLPETPRRAALFSIGDLTLGDLCWPKSGLDVPRAEASFGLIFGWFASIILVCFDSSVVGLRVLDGSDLEIVFPGDSGRFDLDWDVSLIISSFGFDLADTVI